MRRGVEHASGGEQVVVDGVALERVGAGQVAQHVDAVERLVEVAIAQPEAPRLHLGTDVADGQSVDGDHLVDVGIPVEDGTEPTPGGACRSGDRDP